MPPRSAVSERDFPIGTFESPTLNAAQAERYSRVTITRVGWPDTGADVIRVTQYYSADGGTTWAEFGGFTARGGTILDQLGNVVTEHVMITSAFPGESVPQRRVKFVVNIYAPLRAAVNLDTSATKFNQGGG